MATLPAEAWTYTGGYPHSLHQSTIHPPRGSEVKSIFNTPHMLVTLHAAALNPVDIQMMNLPSWRLPWNGLYGKEKGVGCDFSGTVKAGGRSGFQQGDEVFGITLKPFMPHGGSLATMAEFNMAMGSPCGPLVFAARRLVVAGASGPLLAGRLARAFTMHGL